MSASKRNSASKLAKPDVILGDKNRPKADPYARVGSDLAKVDAGPEYPNDALTMRVRQSLKAGRKMKRDADGWLVDADTGELIGPDPAIEREWTDEEFERAQLRIGDKVVRRGRPPLAAPKQPIRLRLDADVVAHFRSLGPGWQTRINEALRRAAKLKRAE